MAHFNINMNASTLPPNVQPGVCSRDNSLPTKKFECNNYVQQSQYQQIASVQHMVDNMSHQRPQIRRQSTHPANQCQPQLYMFSSPYRSNMRSPEFSAAEQKYPMSAFSASHRSKISASTDCQGSSSSSQQYGQLPTFKIVKNDELDQVIAKPRMPGQITLPSGDQTVNHLPTSPLIRQTSPQYRRSPELTRQQTLPNSEAFSSSNFQTLHPSGESNINSQAKFMPISPRQKNAFLFPNAPHPRPFLSQQNVPTVGITESDSFSEDYLSSQSVNVHQSRDNVKMMKIRSHSNEEYTINKSFHCESRRLLPEIPTSSSGSRTPNRLVRQNCVKDEFYRRTFGESKQQFLEYENVTEENKCTEFSNSQADNSSNFVYADVTQYGNNYIMPLNSGSDVSYNDGFDYGTYSQFQPTMYTGENIQVADETYVNEETTLKIPLSNHNVRGSALPQTPQMHNRLSRRESSEIKIHQEELQKLRVSPTLEAGAIVTAALLTDKMLGIPNTLSDISSENKQKQMRSISEDSGVKVNAPKVATRRSLSHPEKNTQYIKTSELTKIPSPKPLADLMEKTFAGTKIQEDRKRSSQADEIAHEKRSLETSSNCQLPKENVKELNEQAKYDASTYDACGIEKATKLQYTSTLGDQEIQNAVEAAAVIFKKVVLQRRQEKKTTDEDAYDLETPTDLEFKSIAINRQQYNTEADEFKLVFLNSDSSSSCKEEDDDDCGDSSSTASSSCNCNSIKIDDCDWDYFEPMMLYKQNVGHSTCSSPTVTRNKYLDFTSYDSAYSPLDLPVFHRKPSLFYQEPYESDTCTDDEFIMEGESSTQTSSDNNLSSVSKAHLFIMEYKHRRSKVSKTPNACYSFPTFEPAVLSNKCNNDAEQVRNETFSPQSQYVLVPVPVPLSVPMAEPRNCPNEILHSVTSRVSNLLHININNVESLCTCGRKLWCGAISNLTKQATTGMNTSCTYPRQNDVIKTLFESPTLYYKSPTYTPFTYRKANGGNSDVLFGVFSTDCHHLSTQTTNNYHQHYEASISSLPDRKTKEDHMIFKQIGDQNLSSVLTKSISCPILSTLEKIQHNKEVFSLNNRCGSELLSDEHLKEERGSKLAFTESNSHCSQAIPFSQSSDSASSSNEENYSNISTATTDYNSSNSEALDADTGTVPKRKTKKRQFSKVFFINPCDDDDVSGTSTDTETHSADANKEDSSDNNMDAEGARCGIVINKVKRLSDDSFNPVDSSYDDKPNHKDKANSIAELNSISNDVNRLLKLDKQSSEFEIKLQKLKNDVAEINKDHLVAAGNTDGDAYGNSNLIENEARKLTTKLYEHTEKTSTNQSSGEPTRNNRQTSAGNRKFDNQFLNKNKTEPLWRTTTAPTRHLSAYKENIGGTAITMVDYKKAKGLCLSQNSINHIDEKQPQNLKAKQNRYPVVVYGLTKGLEDEDRNNKESENNRAHRIIVGNSDWLDSTHKTACKHSHFNEQKQVIVGQEHQQPQLALSIANRRAKQNSVKCQENKTASRGKKTAITTETSVLDDPEKTPELNSESTEHVDEVQTVERERYQQDDCRPETCALTNGKAVQAEHEFVSKSAKAQQTVSNEMLSEVEAQDRTLLHSNISRYLSECDNAKAINAQVSEYSEDFDKVYGRNVKSAYETAEIDLKITPHKYGSPNSLSAKYRSLVMISKEQCNESVDSNVEINTTAVALHATRVKSSSYDDSAESVDSNCGSAGVTIISSEENNCYDTAPLTATMKKCNEMSEPLETNSNSTVSSSNTEKSWLTSDRSDLNVASLLISQPIASVDDSEISTTASERLENSRAKMSSICLEDGLADDDSWVEEMSEDLEDDSMTPTASDFEDPNVDSEDPISVRDDSISNDREEELRAYYRSAIDFTLHTIVEESCEESELASLREYGDCDIELDDLERRQQRSVNHPNRLSASDLEKYFFFGLGDGNAMSSVETRGEDSTSEDGSEYSDGLESLEVAEESLKDVNTSTELASSRLEKYFLSGFMGFSGATDKNDSEESGSVGSDSEGHPSPSQRRKRLVRARGTPRSHNSSLDNLIVDGSQTIFNVDPFETTLLGGGNGDILDSSGSEACDDTLFHNSITGEKTVDNGSLDTTKRKKQVRKRHDSLDEKRLHESVEENPKLAVASAECRTPTPGSISNSQGKKAHNSRDSGFIGSNDDLLKTPDNEVACVRTKFPTCQDQKNKDKVCEIICRSLKSDKTLQSTQQSDSVTKDNSLPIKASSNTSLVRKDSFNNWSSDEETNVMMSKMRQFFKTLIAATANAQQNSLIANVGKSTISSSTNQSSPCQTKTHPVQLSYFENELTRLMKTVPGINEEQVREIVEYLSSEDTWSDSCDSSDYTSSDLESVTSISRKGELKEQITASCQQIISKFEIDENNVCCDGGLPSESDGLSDNTTLVYKKLVDSFSKIAVENVSKATPIAPPTTSRVDTFEAIASSSKNEAQENYNSSTRCLERSPQLFAKVMQHIGTRLVMLMHEVSSGNDTHGTNSPVPPQRQQKRLLTKVLVTTTEDEHNQHQSNYEKKAKDDLADNLARSKSHDILLDRASGLVVSGSCASTLSTSVTQPHHHQSNSGVSDTTAEEYAIASDYERFSWRGSFESALLANGDSRTKLSQLDRGNSSSASALAVAKRRSAGDLLFNQQSLNREQLDRVRSCGSIGYVDERHQHLECSKPWASSEDSKDLCRSSIPDELYESNSSDDNSNFEARSTLPRSLVGAAMTSTNSLPRLHKGTTSTPITKSQSALNYVPINPKSARYRSPGIAIRANSSLGTKKSISALGLHNFLYSKKDARKRLTYFGEERKAAEQEIGSSPILGLKGPESPLHSHGSGTIEQCLVQSDEDIDRLVSMHQNRSSLSSCGLRSDSMASVYSGAGDGRYGPVMVKGQVEFGMQYNYKLSALEIHMVRCKDLAAVDLKRNRSDPYVKIYLLPDKSKSGKRKTKVRKHTLNPIFDEVLRFHMPLSSLESRTLWLSVWHSDIFGRNDFLGEVNINLQGKVFDNPQSQWYNLQERSEPFEEVASYRGDIVVGLKYIPPEKTGSSNSCSATSSTSNLRKFGSIKSVGIGSKADRTYKGGQLHVLVKGAKHLTPIKPSGSCDTFCKSYLLPDRTRTSKQKTPVVKRSLHPNWNYTFVYEDVWLEDLPERALELTVWDHDRLSSNEFLGGVRFSLGSGKSYGYEVDWMDATGKEISLWKNMLHRPNFWVEGSLVLRPNLDGTHAAP